ncbi:hypothetical protein J8273_4048 [Carpediemonas membranifera]|uniref:Uncharacterized protein n=1 Tax=Carpediemonas membranifera TaxID=201153 RepID=A0A8J6E011_9EUKA|nr:hypothetical protein J8273_4048 [Carpediemonas membranifera]|eukprot:KAG9394404.1 hypothetical protein J8273_4048 [Carpediemonas membranifera]
MALVAWTELIPNRTQASVLSLKSLLRELRREARPSTRATKAEILRAVARHFSSVSGTSTVDSEGSDTEDDPALTPADTTEAAIREAILPQEGGVLVWLTPALDAALSRDSCHATWERHGSQVSKKTCDAALGATVNMPQAEVDST